MTSHGKARPLFTIAAIAALAVGVAACNSGGAQSGGGSGYPGYSNPGVYQPADTNPNYPDSIGAGVQAQQNRDSAINDMGPGGAADPNDDGNSVSYSGGGDDGSGG